jgi:alpha-ketoglutaric semialdehyde dehydrogenase
MTPPMGLVGGAIGPALVTGNAVVWKPCLRSPYTSQMLAEILVEAGVPAGVLNLVHGDGFDVGQAIVDHRGIAAVSFTGLRAVGEHVHRAVSKRLAKVRFELGGKNPLVVLADADIELGANAVIRAHSAMPARSARRRAASSSRHPPAWPSPKPSSRSRRR